MYKISERRKYKRLEKPFITRFRIKPAETQGPISNDWDMVAVSNLGAGGIFFHTRKCLDIGTAMDLKIGFSITSPGIKCVGRVVRSKRHLDTSIYGIAIAFTEIEEHITWEIDKTTKKLLMGVQSCQY